MSQILPMVGPTSEIGKDLTAAMQKLGKHVPPGTVTPAGQQQMAQRLMQAGQQAGPQLQALQKMQQQPPGGAPGGGGAPGAGMQPH